MRPKLDNILGHLSALREFRLPNDAYPYIANLERWMKDYWKDTPPDLAPVSFSKNEVDFAYLAGVFNSLGIDGLANELERLKELNVMPHQMLLIARKPQHEAIG